MEKKSVLGPWKQGLRDTSETATEIVGTMREDLHGRVYRYSRAGATALAPGKATTAPLLNADWVNETPAAAAIGATQISITHVAVGTDTLPEDYFRGGQLQVNDEAGEGHWYDILHSTAVTATSTTLRLTLEQGLKVAITASSEVTPVPSPFMATVISGTETHEATGTPLCAVPAEYYYWSQTGGSGVYWANADVAAVGTQLVLSADDGELAPRILDYDASADADATQAPVAIATGTAGVDTEYKPCKWIID